MKTDSLGTLFLKLFLNIIMKIWTQKVTTCFNSLQKNLSFFYRFNRRTHQNIKKTRLYIAINSVDYLAFIKFSDNNNNFKKIVLITGTYFCVLQLSVDI